MRIDAHQHFWDPARGDYGWIPPGDAVLDRAYGPADLWPMMQAAGVDGTVLVQAAPTLAETEWLLEIAAATPFVQGVVGWIDFDDPGQRRELDRLARHPKMLGLRPMVQDIADPDWINGPSVQWAFAAIMDHDLTFDALGLPRHLEPFRRLFRRYPGLRAVVDHGMKPAIRDSAFDKWAEGIARIAGETGAFCKLSGLVTEAAPGWTDATLAPYATHLLASFGPDRVMWGSDWPVCGLRAPYGDWHAAAQRLTAHLPTRDRDRIFGGTAKAFYAL
ncbi:MAG TPA: amidohydrolase family protein [Paracoccaceae bacterium]|nr:amidohydrolase family protein [Paracoccaceae bacterium]